MEQLRVHDGVVRCGRCDNVFSADQQLFSNIPDKATEKPAPRKKSRSDGSAKPKSTKPKAATPVKRTPVTRTKAVAEPEPAPEAVKATPVRQTPPIDERVKTYRKPARAADSLDMRLESPTAPPPRRFSALWIVGAVVLTATLAAQSAYFYRDRLAAYSELRPYLNEMCVHLHCDVQPPYDADRIELIQPTNIAPHPRIANALRLRATLVNRSNNVQAHPYMQVTLTDRTGGVLARRVFSPRQYVEQPAALETDMPPHLAVSALIDITNPDGKAVGYQINFLPPPPD